MAERKPKLRTLVRDTILGLDLLAATSSNLAVGELRCRMYE